MGARAVGGERFDYRIHKDGVVRIFWEGRCVTVMKGERARELTARLAGAGDAEVQHLLQRVTGNFKRGNERQTRKR